MLYSSSAVTVILISSSAATSIRYAAIASILIRSSCRTATATAICSTGSCSSRAAYFLSPGT